MISLKAMKANKNLKTILLALPAIGLITNLACFEKAFAKTAVSLVSGMGTVETADAKGNGIAIQPEIRKQLTLRTGIAASYTVHYGPDRKTPIVTGFSALVDLNTLGAFGGVTKSSTSTRYRAWDSWSYRAGLGYSSYDFHASSNIRFSGVKALVQVLYTVKPVTNLQTDGFALTLGTDAASLSGPDNAKLNTQSVWSGFIWIL